MTEPFTLLSELGRGGMGVAWKARHAQTQRVLALEHLRAAHGEDHGVVP